MKQGEMMNKSIPFNQLKVVHVGMIIRSLNGEELSITNIYDLNENSYTSMVVPEDNSMILQLNHELYLSTDIGWKNMSNEVKVVNAGDFN